MWLYIARMNDLQTQILDAALPAVVFDGWTVGTLERAAESIGRTAFDARRAFPGGVMEALAVYSARADARMVEALPDLVPLKIRERIATAVMVRLRQQAPEREAIRRAVAVYALPWNIAAATRALYDTVDAIWRAAGDISTDYNFYTKRLLLAKVYTTTRTVWLGDMTEDLHETEAFLRRRIENVMQIEKLKAKAKDSLGGLADWLPKAKQNA